MLNRTGVKGVWFKHLIQIGRGLPSHTITCMIVLILVKRRRCKNSANPNVRQGEQIQDISSIQKIGLFGQENGDSDLEVALKTLRGPHKRSGMAGIPLPILIFIQPERLQVERYKMHFDQNIYTWQWEEHDK